MTYKEEYTHRAFDCEVRFRVNKPKVICYLFKHLILDCGIVDYRPGLKPIISSFSQAEASIIEWYDSGGWMKICGSDKDREEWCKHINDASAFDEIEITKMEKTWFNFLQDPHDYIDRQDVFWIQVNAQLKVWEESVRRPIVNRDRILVAIPSKERNQYGYYMFTDDMKEQAISMVRDYYSYDIEKNCVHPKVDVELSADRSYKDCVVCANR